MDLEVIIGQMSEKDIATVIAIGLQTPEFKTGTDAQQFYSNQTLRRWVADKNGVTLVAKTKERIVGFALGYYMAGPNDGYLNCVVVLPEYQRKSIGKRLLHKALSEFETKGRCNHVFCVVKASNQSTLSFFENEGLQIGGTFRYVEVMLPLKE
ncbi:GNAT family N-acetyltransferase [Candidatus Woesearchaeota archaeon]|nr:GNAT family N-acetyltransferase [Candidatus Woesearchaeota archaeon]